ncbi:MarC family transcriptional regulator [Endozoicomonas sp. OPT23]|uniref:MarC family protein n=1 Tax=Endozoicomonas sp. OPT23 TaxID=2072845 RepID=UPI00129AF4A5|nr:MarC family protein [Endozoicomonas sp. OPT23]MRI32175.1 MarC family transcriptional regulator [Endozoicomonas sp. OPT23]
MQQLIHDFILLFAVIDPIGTLLLFLSITGGYSSRDRKRIALRASLYSGGILLMFVLVGQLLLTAMGIRLVSFQIAGGIILFLFGLKMIFGEDVSHSHDRAEPGHDIAVFPLAIPSMASPGALTAVVILTDNRRFSVDDQIVTSIILVGVILITYLLLLAANTIHKWLGDSGSAILIRVMGMILGALAVEIVIQGIAGLQGNPATAL